jgi:rhodanese-related sulfurtransferase
LKPCFSMSHPSRVRTSPHRRLRPDAAWRFEYRGSEAISRGQSACLLICRSGNRARQAAEKLKSSGLPSLEVLTGGVLAWDAAGLPLNRGTKSMSLERQVRIAAGALVFIGAALGYFVNPAWIALPAFVGAGLVFAGITDTCGMGMLIALMPWNNRRRSSAG